ncbi:Uncharacterized protein FWK35_00021572 [Aphis craccivora]|uniref:Uncharacterized protein n=1 Tax=Aphis craccivora TaxID=307492 RepID=A0A6G0YIT4_APHCR|nr:Uncharacterized protein FWK35_00021572 [Aphis craccivora]
MSNNTCDAIRHKTKRFSFKRKPFNGKQIGNQPKMEVKKEVKKEVKEEAKVSQEPQERHEKPEVVCHNKPKKTGDDNTYLDHNESIITQDDNSNTPDGFKNKATQTRICCIHNNHCKRKQSKRNGNFFPDAWLCLTNLCK